MTNPEVKVSQKVRELADFLHTRMQRQYMNPKDFSEAIQAALSELLEAGREIVGDCQWNEGTAHASFAAILSKWERK